MAVDAKLRRTPAYPAGDIAQLSSRSALNRFGIRWTSKEDLDSRQAPTVGVLRVPERLVWATMDALVNVANLVGLLVALWGLRLTYQQAAQAKSQAEQAKTAAEAATAAAQRVASRSAEHRLNSQVADLRLIEQMLETACASNNAELARMALFLWRNGAVEASGVLTTLNIPAHASLSKYVTSSTAIAAATANDLLDAGSLSVRDTTTQARVHVAGVLRIMSEAAVGAAVSPDPPEVTR